MAHGPESGDDVEEDGFDVGTHGGGSLEGVAEFDGAHALTEGFTILDEGEAIDLATVPPVCDETFDQPESVCGRDDRVKISRSTLIPWRMICKLIITTASGSRSGCTGWLIGPRTVIMPMVVVQTNQPGSINRSSTIGRTGKTYRWLFSAFRVAGLKRSSMQIAPTAVDIR